MKFTHFFMWMGFGMAVVLSGCSTSKGLQKEDVGVKEATLREAIENRAFIIEVDRVFPMGGNARMLTSIYSLEVRGDSVKSYLPYFGRAYSVPYGGGDGLVFNAVIADYQSKIDKKGKVEITFKTKSKEDQLTYRITISSSGSSSIQVTSTNRQPISYSGKTYAGKMTPVQSAAEDIGGCPCRRQELNKGDF